MVGHGADQLTAHLAEIAPDAATVLQAEQRGTGHAARMALEALGPPTGTVVVVNGDVPAAAAGHADLAGRGARGRRGGGHHPDRRGGEPVRAGPGDPQPGDRRGGRDRRGARRHAGAARDHARSTPACTRSTPRCWLRRWASSPPTTSRARSTSPTSSACWSTPTARVVAYATGDPTEVLGCNDRVELAGLRAILRDRINLSWMRAGRHDHRPGDHLDRRDVSSAATP